MDGKGFFLGLIAAVVLFLLWKKETSSAGFGTSMAPQPSASGPGGGCAGCSGPSAAASPGAQGSAYQARLVASAPDLPVVGAGTDGQISPGTPPLQGSLGVGSFYNPTGPTPDNTFLTTPLVPKQIVNTAAPIVKVYSNVPGSPSTPANQVPVRAVQPVAPTSQLGFQQRYSYVGISRQAGARQYVM